MPVSYGASSVSHHYSDRVGVFLRVSRTESRSRFLIRPDALKRTNLVFESFSNSDIIAHCHRFDLAAPSICRIAEVPWAFRHEPQRQPRGAMGFVGTPNGDDDPIGARSVWLNLVQNHWKRGIWPLGSLAVRHDGPVLSAPISVDAHVLARLTVAFNA
jgi:hypothetical protein